MIKLHLVGLVLVSFASLASLAGCASSPHVAPQLAVAVTSAEIPRAEQVEATAANDEVEAVRLVAERPKNHVEITVDKLPDPKKVMHDAVTYVVWVRSSDQNAWTNAAHLAPSTEAQEALFEYPEDTLFVHVTAEPTPEARVPSDFVLLSTRVNKGSACASHVDQNNLAMKVRMCK